MATKVGSTRIYRNEGLLTILHAGNQVVFNHGMLQWRKDKEAPPELREYLTLDEIAEQMNELNCFPPYLLINEGALQGIIYMWGNYSDKAWYKHGTTRGYA